MADRSPSSRTYRVTCPHNCYDSCGMLATVSGDVVRHVEGDPAHPYTGGRLCSKGYSYVDRVYATDRLRHPMLQSPRGSGHWRRITWDEALGRIAAKLVELRKRYGSMQSACLYKGSGNIGVLHFAPEGLFQSMGAHTEAENVLCWAYGADAQRYDFGELRTSDPKEMLNARTLILWGVNPAWTAPHQMNLIMQARDNGATVVVVDPIHTATASRADVHVAPRPGTDGALALGMARVLLDEGLTDTDFLKEHTLGWPTFLDYLRSDVTLDWAAAQCGLPPETITDLARLYATGGPAMIWMGYGMQRYANSLQTVRAINALAALTGQIGRPGTGIQYAQLQTWVFGNYVKSFTPTHSMPYKGPGASGTNRTFPMGTTAHALTTLKDPPVRFLWVSGGNPVSQEPDAESFRSALHGLEMVVVVDQFMTRTAAEADIVLPATTFLEQWDLNLSYLNHCISISERAIAPLYESHSDLAIAWALSKKLNELSPGICAFPSEGDEREWIEREWSGQAARLFGIASPEALKQGPVRANLPLTAWHDHHFATPSGRIELESARAVAEGRPAIAVYQRPAPAPSAHPVRLLTPHPAESLHSQFHNQTWAMRVSPHPMAEIHPDLAESLGVSDGDTVRIYNDRGSITLSVLVTLNAPPGTVVAYEAVYADPAYNVNLLTGATPPHAGFPGVAYADCFVAVEPARRGG